jgi:UDP-N-acetylmuramyl pentapeptide synthase
MSLKYKLTSLLSRALKDRYQSVSDFIQWIIFFLARLVQAVWLVFPYPINIGITGSCGKSTAQWLLGEITLRRGRTDYKTNNQPIDVALRRFTLGPWYRYWVQEIATSEQGQIARQTKFFRPDIAVVTVVRDDHYVSFRSRDAVADEKFALVAALPKKGVAVLNADDPRVLAMAERTDAKVITYGLAENADLRATDVSSIWPAGLSMQVSYQGKTIPINTRLFGEFWVTSVLAAIGGALAAGFSLQECADVIAATEPVVGRMSETVSQDGVAFLRDDIKAPFWTIPAVLEVLEQADARRKVFVIGTMSDYPGAGSRKYRKVARDALDVAEKVIFVGDFAGSAVRASTNPGDGSLLGFNTLYEANQHLQEYLEPGDLVLLKGSYKVDHLHRVIMDRSNEIACWRHKCGRVVPCYACTRRMQKYIPFDEIAAENQHA